MGSTARETVQGERAPRMVYWAGTALLVYAVMAVVMTWPVALHLSDRFAGGGVDLKVSLWDMWWVERVALDGEAPLHTRHLFYPEGVSLAHHSISWRAGLFALPLRAAFGPITGYNLFFLGETVACCFATFLLALRLGGRPDAAIVSGAVLGFFPYRMAQAASHPNLGSLSMIPLSLLCVEAALQTRKPAWIIAGGACTALVLLTGAHLFIMTTGLLVALCLVRVVQQLQAGQAPRQVWVTVAAVAAACAVLCGPLLLQFVGPGAPDMERALSVKHSRHPGDLAGFVTPWPRHLLFGGAVAKLDLRPGKWGHYLGIGALGLLAASTFAKERRRELSPYALGTVAFLLLSLGPHLHIAGHRWEWPMPYDLIGWARPIQALRSPDRFGLLVGICLALGAGWGYARLVRTSSLRGRSLSLLLCLLVLGADYWPVPYRTFKGRLGAAHRALLQESVTGAVIELPMHRQASKEAMFAQTRHGRPLVSGMVARLPAEARRYIRRSALLRALAKRRPKRYRCRRFDLPGQWAKLEREGFSHVVFHPLRYRAREREHVRSYLRAAPVVVSKDQLLFRLADLAALPSHCGTRSKDP